MNVHESSTVDETTSRLERSIHGLAREHPRYSAARRFTARQVVGAALISAVVIVGFVTVGTIVGTIVMAIVIACYALSLGLRIDLSRRAESSSRWSFTAEQLALVDDATLPSFTVMVPAYREPEVIGALLDNLGAIDYPQDRLQVLLLLEEDDLATVHAARAHAHGGHIEIVLVPAADPRTKPKALNYALGMATGDIVTIYDAEDQPDPLQLRRVAATFAAAGPNVACVQAELAFYNADENQISRWFAIEYATWFRQFLPALAAVGAAIPLGGTSNHIRRDLLIGLGAWDPYNVTEDADLGVRLRRQGFLVAVVESMTLEEANTDFVNWVKQRSRWYKGYTQTWLVHMRNPLQLLRELGFVNFLRFNFFVGGTPLLALLNPISWLLLAMWFTLEPAFIVAIMPPPLYYTGLAVWIIGNTALYYVNMVMAFDLRLRRIFWASLALPVYWAMMSIAAYKALIQLILTPSYWEKTHHGLSAHRQTLAV